MSDINVSQLLSQLRETAALAKANPESQQAATEQVNFSEMLGKAINKVNDTQQHAGKLSDAFVSGDPNVSLTEVMVAGQKASISFQAMLQVRNRLIQAYQDVMNMQI